MKKFLLGTVVLLLISWAATTWMISGQVEKNFDNAVNVLNQRLQQEFPLIQVKPVSFEKGLLSSRASSQVMVPGEAGSVEGTITLKHQIFHGPVMLTPLGVKAGSTYILTTLDIATLPAEGRKAIEKAFAGQEPLRVGLLTKTGKDIGIDLEVAAATVADDTDNGGALRFDGLNAALETDFAGSYLTGKAATGPLSIADSEGVEIEIGPSNSDFDIDTLYKGTVLSGGTRVHVDNMRTTAGGKPLLDMGNIRVESQTEQTPEQTTTSSLTVDATSLQLGAKDKGIQLNNGHLQLATTINGLDTRILKRVTDAAMQLHQKEMQSLARAMTDQPSAADAEVMTTAARNYVAGILELIKPGISNKNRISLTSDAGSMHATLELAYAGKRALQHLGTLRELISAIDGNLVLTVDDELLQAMALDKAAALPVAFGLANHDNGKLESRVSIENGIISVNGQPVPILEMLGPVLDQPLQFEQLFGSAV